MRVIASATAALLLTAAAAGFAVPVMAQEGDDEVPVVDIALTEFSLGFNERLVPGPRVRFNIVNSGTIAHAFALQVPQDGSTAVVETPRLEPGEEYELIVELPPGEYTVYCPVGDHRDQGMRGTLIVQNDG